MGHPVPRASRQVVLGAASGAAGTVILTGFRRVMARLGLIFETAPDKVLTRVQELGMFHDLGTGSRRMLILVAHYGYGVGAGTALGLLRRRRDGPVTEALVGAALGVLVWGAGWSFWLPLLRVEGAPWTWGQPTVVLPVLDHAAYGLAWGFTYWALRGAIQDA